MYSIGKFAKKIGVSLATLRNWHKDGTLVPAKITNGGTRYYSEKQLNEYTGIRMPDRKNYIYARVSNCSQKSDLENQVKFIMEFANSRGLSCEVLKDIGSGLNYNREKWNFLLREVENGSVENIIISYKDRFIRFGFDWFNNFCARHNTNIIVANNEYSSPEKELINDLISIIHVFSCRIYGLRKYKKVIKDEMLQD